MNRRQVLRLTGAATLTLFYPAADRPPMSSEDFVRNIIANNQRLARMMTANGWPAPTAYMGEGVDIPRLAIKKQYAGLTVQTSHGPRFVLVQLDSNGYHVSGVYAEQPDRLPAASTVTVPGDLLTKNIAWSRASRLLDAA
jgi:hypothetical protein